MRRRRLRLPARRKGHFERPIFAVQERAREVDGEERAEELGRSLDRAQDQPSSRQEGALEASDRLPLDFGSEVHEHVAAQDQVHRAGVRDQRWVAILGQVEGPEGHHPSDARIQLEHLSSCGAKVAGSDPRWRLAEGPLPVEPARRDVERVAVDVGSEKREPPTRAVGEQTVEENRQRVGLLPRSAPGAPEPEPQQAFRAPLGDEHGEDVLLQGVETGAITEEVGLTHGEPGCDSAPFRAAVGKAGEPREIGLW